MITMFKTAAALAIVGAGGFAAQPARAAHLSLGFGIAVAPSVVTYAPAPVYYAPAPASYYAVPTYSYAPPVACPAPVVVPAPVVYAPPLYYSAPTYYSAPVYCPSIGFRLNFFGGHGHR